MDENILDVARTIRAYLPGLLGGKAEPYDRELSALLAEARAGVDVEGRLVDLLTRSPVTHAWAARVLEDPRHRPPELQLAGDRGVGLPGLPGDPQPVDAVRYSCPLDHDFVWWRIFVGDPVPHCRYHPGVLLVAG